MVFYICVSLSDIPKARVLGEVLKKHDQSAKLYLLLQDKTSKFNIDEEPFDEILYSNESVAEHQGESPFWQYICDVVQESTQIKGWIATKNLQHEKQEQIVYFTFFPDSAEEQLVQTSTPSPDYNELLQAVLNSRSYRFGNQIMRIANHILPSPGILRRGYHKIKKCMRYFFSKGPYSLSGERLDKKRRDDSTIVPEQYVLGVYDAPRFSILIPDAKYFGNIYRCLQSITCNNAKSIRYEIFVSGDLHPFVREKLQKSFKNLSITIGESLYSMIARAKGEYVLLLSETAQTPDAFLEATLNQFSETNAAVLQACVYFENGEILEAGGVVLQDGRRLSYGYRINHNWGRVRYCKEIDCTCLSGVAFKRSLYETIGGFDKQFSSLYQLADFSFALRTSGKKTLYIPDLTIYDMRDPKLVKQIAGEEKDAPLFVQKWGSVLNEENISDEQEMFWGRDRSKNRITVFTADDRVPCYDKSAGDRTTFQYLEQLTSMGYNIKYVGNDMCRHEPYTTMLEKMGIEFVGLDGAGDVEWCDFIRENGSFIDIAYLNRPYILKKYHPVLQQYTNAKIIYYCMDLHFIREQREFLLKNDEKGLKRIAQIEKDEIATTNLADVVLTLSTYEKKILEKRISHSQVVLNPIFIYKEFPAINQAFLSRKDIIFVGGFGHPPNIDAVEWFVGEVFPLIHKVLSNVTFHIAGNSPPESVLQLQSKNIIIHGYIPDKELAELYQNCRVCVIPLRYGAGIKGKMIEAMYYGMPIVATSIGTEGIVDIEKCVQATDTPEEFARSVIELYSNVEALETASRKNQQYCKDNLGVKPAQDFFQRVFVPFNKPTISLNFNLAK